MRAARGHVPTEISRDAARLSRPPSENRAVVPAIDAPPPGHAALLPIPTWTQLELVPVMATPLPAPSPFSALVVDAMVAPPPVVFSSVQPPAVTLVQAGAEVPLAALHW